MQESRPELALFSLKESAQSFSMIDCDFLNLVLTARPVNLPPGHHDLHEDYEFFIPLSSIPRFFIDDQEFDCLPGCLIPINPGLLHGVRSGRKATSFILVFIEQEWLNKMIGQVSGEGSRHGFPLASFPLQTDIQSLIDRLIQEHHGSGAGRGILMRSLAEALTVLLIRHYYQPAGQQDLIDPNHLSGEQFRFQSALTFMQEHYNLRMSIDKLAALSNMNCFHFIRTFKKQFLISPYNYLTRIRITNARRLLIQSKMPVSQIGRQCGFPSASRFSAVFQKVTGLTPSRFRKVRKPY